MGKISAHLIQSRGVWEPCKAYSGKWTIGDGPEGGRQGARTEARKPERAFHPQTPPTTERQPPSVTQPRGTNTHVRTVFGPPCDCCLALSVNSALWLDCGARLGAAMGGGWWGRAMAWAWPVLCCSAMQRAAGGRRLRGGQNGSSLTNPTHFHPRQQPTNPPIHQPPPSTGCPRCSSIFRSPPASLPCDARLITHPRPPTNTASS